MSILHGFHIAHVEVCRCVFSSATRFQKQHAAVDRLAPTKWCAIGLGLGQKQSANELKARLKVEKINDIKQLNNINLFGVVVYRGCLKGAELMLNEFNAKMTQSRGTRCFLCTFDVQCMDSIHDGLENYHRVVCTPAAPKHNKYLLQVTCFYRGVWHSTAGFFSTCSWQHLRCFHSIRCTAACGALRGTPDATISTSLTSCGLDVASAERGGSGS